MSVKIKGIDVSVNNGAIDWQKVKADGVEFAIIKATQGRDAKYPNGFVESMFEKNYAGAKAAGIQVGAYHFAVFTSSEQAIAEARQFMDACKGKQFDYPLCLDLEDLPAGRNPILSKALTKQQLTDYAVLFMEELKRNGYRPMLYTNTDWRNNRLEFPRLSGYLLWQAHYPPNPDAKPSAIDEKVAIWQYSSAGKVNGINGNVDLNWDFVGLANPSASQPLENKPNIGDTIGSVLHTDIKAYVNDKLIPSFNIGGKTCICFEDLTDHGFKVTWDAAKREVRAWK